ncbi:ATP-dependent zinc metalloprotease FtsH [Candidatus Falkowbacteria bacterium]|uniref:ATP-dependent zinc metalloprotease FtsH n=1 Tax=Candidatus Buchananbacteria bacterium CG10_big_fil_rev_8_21_14_0_10_33_19 TaxID=1974525 RepID=A0A2H0W4R8_9BACT|nr:ATP-dependent zinc metalloprotease FtsH [Candidatus Falkowbacteria bacterium]PIS06346.1 MAG: cell division protein FtsH [Candidatus Buchananbacteria bacterium CG10_big_fil_rev_8_21_14_0_10_33_19]
MKKITKQFLIAFLVFLIFASILSFITLPANKPANINITELLAQIDDGKIKSISVRDNQLDITLNDDTKQILAKEPSESLSTLLSNYEVDTNKLKNIAIDVKSESGFKFWASITLPFLIPLIFILGFFWFMMRQAQGANNKAMSFGQSRAKEFNPNKKLKTTFKDVAGVKEAKKELVEVVEFLKNPKKFLALGAKIPKGVLLLGAPGTGKTLLAKAVAGEANVPFFSISGSEFVEMFVGVGASRVRDLFSKAKKNSPCIIFIDEIDAVGRQRGAGLGGSHDEREQTLNQILVEMDGFDERTNVIVVAGTNRPDVLDAALLRPGRFDRRVTLDMPDINDREAILKVHSTNKPFTKDVDMRLIASRTPGFSGADLANLLNESAILAALENKKEINNDHILESIDKIMIGPQRKSHILNEHEKEVTAYHEAGHAIVAHLLPNTDPVSKVSIIARGSAAGFTLKLPLEDKKLHTKTEFLEDMAVMLAGQTAEKIVFNEITTGAQGDLRQVTALAKQLITSYGMSEKMGLRTFGKKDDMVFLGKDIHEQRDYSEKTAEQIDEEIHRLTEDARKLAEKIITENRTQLDKIVVALKEKETIEAEEFKALFEK